MRSLALALALVAAPALAQPAAQQALRADDAVLVLIDFTDGLYPIVETIEIDEMLNNAVGAAKIADTFDVPIMVVGSEGGFYGDMHPAIKSFAGPGMPFGRNTPSAFASGGLRDAVEATGRRQVVIGGITTDNCTLLTSLDLLRAGYEVFVVADISGSDSQAAHEAALARLRDAGAVTTGWVAFGAELLPDWRTPEGEALLAIYDLHINGPRTTGYGASTNSDGSEGDSE